MKDRRARYKPVDEDEENFEDGELENDSDDGMSSVSFGALSKAQRSLEQEQMDDSEDEGIDLDAASDSDDAPEEVSATAAPGKKRHKHAPGEASAKKPVSWIREIPGLKKKTSTLHTDIRFDPAYGKSDLAETRQNYAFLNDYRESELADMKKQLTTSKDEREQSKLRAAILKQESRLKTFKNRDFERDVLRKHEQEARKNNFYLKKSDKKKLVLTEKFKSMKSKDRSKALERRRKKNAAKERKQMPLERRG